ncbi:hypothetical protein GALL_182770 [mine drainage metagenome]|uniref:Uncharacterized protein n=1 Tax=mine drainage metagenome TaxID=410659 RepID=A0A1J5RVL2_9ZZZZ
MSLDSVHPGISSGAIRPGQDARDDRRPDSQQREKPKPAAKDQPLPGEPGTVVNDLGQVTGRTINVTA